MSQTGVSGDSLQRWLGRTELVAAHHGDEVILAVNDMTEFGHSTMRTNGQRSNFVKKDFVAVRRSRPVTVSVIWSEETVTAGRSTNSRAGHILLLRSTRVLLRVALHVIVISQIETDERG